MRSRVQIPRPHELRSRRFRFWTGQSQRHDAAALTERARQAEACGFDAIVVADHLLDSIGPVAFLTHVAAVTKRLRVGTFVLNNDLRHPVVLAQELASIDRLSGAASSSGLEPAGTSPSTARRGSRTTAPASELSGSPSRSLC